MNFGLQVFVRKVIELHDKYLAYVNDCFQNHTLFHKVCLCKQFSDCSCQLILWISLKSLLSSTFCFFQALKEAFEIFCNKGVAGSSSAELLATFCDNILKKGGSEKLSDEAIEETLEKVYFQAHILYFFLTFIGMYLSNGKLDQIAGGKAACVYQRQRSICRVLQVVYYCFLFIFEYT